MLFSHIATAVVKFRSPPAPVGIGVARRARPPVACARMNGHAVMDGGPAGTATGPAARLARLFDPPSVRPPRAAGDDRGAGGKLGSGRARPPAGGGGPGPGRRPPGLPPPPG